MNPNQLRALADHMETLQMLREGGFNVTYVTSTFLFKDSSVILRWDDVEECYYLAECVMA